MFPFTALSHPTSDLRHPTLLLHTSEGTRYLFGKVPEGLQRSLNEQKVRCSKVDGIYVTGELNWETMGGMPGMILTISDQGKKDLNVYYGNSYLNYALSTWRSFVFRFGMNLKTKILGNTEVHQDRKMDVQAIVLNKNQSLPETAFEESASDKLKSIVSRMFPMDVKNIYTAEENANTEQNDPKLSDAYIHVKLPVPETSQTSTCYSIQLHKIRGKFSPDKALALGVPKGPIRGQLASGKEVTLSDGTIVKPEQVLSEERHFEKVLIIDIPYNGYLSAAKSAQWGDKVGVIYHFLGEEVDPFASEYAEFIKSFGDDVNHYISHPLYSPDSLVFKGSADLTLKLKSIQTNHFNLPKSYEAAQRAPELPSNVKLLRQGQVSTIECSIITEKNAVKFDESNVNLRTANDWESRFHKVVKPLNLNIKYDTESIFSKNSVSSTQVDTTNLLSDQVETITFGTGSALPSKYRNVISTLVRVPYLTDQESGFKSILLDAGENTLGSIYRTFGKENLATYFSELRLIYLSHLHADHHLGIVSIIKEWFKHNGDSTEKLYLVTPWKYNHFMTEWFKFEKDVNFLERITYISCEDFLSGRKRNEIQQLEFEDFMINGSKSVEAAEKEKDNISISQLYHDLNIERLATCRAIHCDWSYCCSITLNMSGERFKVSYSGDTRPNLYMFSEIIGQDSDLLIHEATLENDLIEEAKKKRHSTINEAIEVSNKMNAKKLILTHFSQRYPQLPSISEYIHVNADYCFAFDCMINKFGDIGDQKEVLEQLREAFKDEEKEAGEGIQED